MCSVVASGSSLAATTLAPTLALHAGQAEVLAFPSRFKVVVAGRRWGKTQLAKVSLIRAASKANRLVWYVAPTYRMAKQIMWHELLKSIPRAWMAGKPNETYLIINLKNGSRIELKGADKPDTLRGVGLHYICCDEFQDFKPDTWEKVLRPTLASTRGHALFIGTPKSFNLLHSIYVKGLDPLLRSRGIWASWQFPTITSPFIPLSEIEAARADMTERAFRQEFEASFETMAGRVYHAFDRHTHVSDEIVFNPKLPIWVGMDFNIDPMSAVILQPQRNGQLWAVDEAILFGSNTQEMAEELDRRFHRFDRRQITLYPDPAGNNRQHGRGESDLDILRERGFRRMKFRRKHPKVADRINAVNKLLRAANGDVRFMISPKCKHLIDAFEQVIYRPGTSEPDKSLGLEHPADGVGYCIEIEHPTRRVKVLGVSV